MNFSFFLEFYLDLILVLHEGHCFGDVQDDHGRNDSQALTFWRAITTGWCLFAPLSLRQKAGTHAKHKV